MFVDKIDYLKKEFFEAFYHFSQWDEIISLNNPSRRPVKSFSPFVAAVQMFQASNVEKLRMFGHFIVINIQKLSHL